MKLYSRTNPESEAIRDLMGNISRRLRRGASFFNFRNLRHQPVKGDAIGLVYLYFPTQNKEGPHASRLS